MDNDEKELLLRQIEELNERIKELEVNNHSVSVPMIPSIIPDTLLIPLSFNSIAFFEHAIKSILTYVNENDDDSVVLDFTGFALNDCDNLEILGENISNLISSLKFMGIRVLVVGLTPGFAKDIILCKLPFTSSLNTFSTFKSALEYLMKIKGLTLVEQSESSEKKINPEQNHSL